MRVIGTAGHVDHGKSTLVEALSGIHPDRLKEEQARQMTIDLGFAWFTLPNGEEVGIVDVPGHRDFIENMLAGVGGIDAALLVIAADEGVMPQTREHLAILDLLQVPAGVIVLSKVDLISDARWFELLEADVRRITRDTMWHEAPIVRVSARTRRGLDELVAALTRVLQHTAPRADLGRPRLPIDRVFTLSGFGTIVTGTLLDGHLQLGDEVQILPPGLRGRIRGLQTHKKKEERALPGARTAVNLAGLAADQVRRGHVLTLPNQYSTTRRLDVQVRLLEEATAALKHGSEVKCFLGTCEVMARVRLLGAEELAPAAQGWAQLELREPIVAVRGDRFILRRPSPAETLGGGVVVEAQPKGRYKRFDEKVLQTLTSLAHGSPSEVLLAAALALGAASVKDVVARSRLEAASASQALRELLEREQLIALEEGPLSPESERLVMPNAAWQELRQKAVRTVEAYHESFPLRRGMPRQELKSKLGLPPRLFNAVLHRLSAENRLTLGERWVTRSGHSPRFEAREQARVEALMQKFRQNPYSPPGVKECKAEVGEEIFNALIEMGKLMPVSDEIVFRKEDYDSMLAAIRSALRQKGRITLAEVRDLFHTSRKYAQALLEHLDALGVTQREGDYRTLRS